MKKKTIIFQAILILSLTTVAFAQTETKIPKDSLPSSIKAQLHNKFHGYSVTNAMKATDPNGTVTYKMETRTERAGNGKLTEYINYLAYDSSGKLLSKKKDKQIFYTDSPKPKPKVTQSNDGHNHQH